MSHYDISSLQYRFLEAILSKSINQIVSTTSSQSMQVVGTFDNMRIFGKIISANFTGTYNAKCDTEQLVLYEERVYREINNQMLNESPNFLKYIDTIYIEKNKLSKPEHQNIYDNLYKELNAKTPCRQVYTALCVYLTEYMKSFELVRAISSFTDNGLKDVIAQIVLSLLVMYKFKLVHNDLHPGNILIDSNINEKKKMDYNLHFGTADAIPFSITSEYKVYIFDWDRSYSEILGDNIGLPYYCDNLGECNTYDIYFDFFKLMCGIKYVLTYGNTLKLDIFDKFFYSSLNITKEDYERIINFAPTDRGDYIGRRCGLLNNATNVLNTRSTTGYKNLKEFYTKYYQIMRGGRTDGEIMKDIINNPYITSCLS